MDNKKIKKKGVIANIQEVVYTVKYKIDIVYGENTRKNVEEKIKRKILQCIILIISFVQIAGCSFMKNPYGQRYEYSFFNLFDTVTTVIGYAKDKQTFEDHVRLIREELTRYHQLFDIYHTYDGMNNLKTINDKAGIEAVHVDQCIIDLLHFSESICEQTDGKMNIAFGSVLSIWHSYREEGIADPASARIPSKEELQEAAQHTDIHNMIIDDEKKTVYVSDPMMKLDVGAVAKGYAVEKITQTLKERQIDHMMISVGGNVRTIGEKPDETGKLVKWTVGIQNPDQKSENKMIHLMSISDRSLVTSGVYERYYTVHGKTYHHIIDTETCMPSDEYKSVSILCENSAMADACSTAVFNMSFVKGKRFIESIPDVEACWIMEDGSCEYSSGFKAYIKK